MTHEEHSRLSEIERRHYTGRVYDLTQAQFNQVRDDVHTLISLARKQADKIAFMEKGPLVSQLAELIHARSELYEKLAAAEAENAKLSEWKRDALRDREEMARCHALEIAKLKAENERMKTGRYERGDLWNAYTDLRRKLEVAEKALVQCRVYSECYDELILTIDEALAQIRDGKARALLAAGTEGR